MKDLDVLKEIFDAKIVKVIHLFMEHPDKQFSLVEVSKKASVSVATSFRILDKLVSKGLVQMVPVEKSKYYKLGKGEKALAMLRIFRNEGQELNEFIDTIQFYPGVKRVVLENRSSKDAKLLIIGDLIPEDKIDEAAAMIKKKHGYLIHFVVFSEKQFSAMEQADIYGLAQKIIWQRN